MAAVPFQIKSFPLQLEAIVFKSSIQSLEVTDFGAITVGSEAKNLPCCDPFSFPVKQAEQYPCSHGGF